ncbi:hypothetical protein PoB_004261200 [Plakobranchus ocellatus]|uniref:Uncharacterized protein n=1 Tax=Plakobranchus ocellatus TaxID=259542 RepID=A0AAV4BAB5_9GAST|nr:hypothetical protein PoB_004261200 [Plakobranchus ocellatus]
MRRKNPADIRREMDLPAIVARNQALLDFHPPDIARHGAGVEMSHASGRILNGSRNFIVGFRINATSFSNPAASNYGDSRLLDPPSGQGASGGAQIRNRRVPADHKADSLSPGPLTPLLNGETIRDLAYCIGKAFECGMRNKRNRKVNVFHFLMKSYLLFFACETVRLKRETKEYLINRDIDESKNLSWHFKR